MKKYLIGLALGLGIALPSAAGVNDVDNAGLLSRSEQMYRQGNYYGAMDQLRLVNRTTCEDDILSRVDYLYARSLFAAGDYTAAAQAYMSYVQQYPATAPEYAAAELGVADCLFASGKYAEAYKAYGLLDYTGLTPAEEASACYRRGISALETGKTAEATKLFTKAAKNSLTRPDAEFYLGVIEFNNKEYIDAGRHFALVTPKSECYSRVPYYMAQIYFVQGAYTKALAEARKHIKGGKSDDAEMLRIAGESLIRTGSAADGIEYLRKYLAQSKDPMPSAQYLVGVADYETGNYAKAIETLTPVTEKGSDVLRQSAYLYIGQALIHEGDADAAILAFDKATKIEADPDVRQAAYFNYAVAKFNGANMPFSSSAQVLEDFMKLYPSGPYSERVAGYLSDGYMADQDYARALASIEKIPYPSDKLLAAKQRALYALGWQNYRAGEYAIAAQYLAKAQELARHDENIAAETALLQGDVLLAQGKAKEAAAKFEEYIRKAPRNAKNKPEAYYGLGYAYYDQKNLNASEKAFETAASTLSSAGAKADALNRIADIRYAAGEFESAAQAYAKAFDANPSAGDYAMFNQARMKGFARDYEGKIAALDQFRNRFPESSLVPESYLETTQAQISLGRNQDAVATYRTLISNYSGTSQGRRGYLQMAMTLLDMGRRDDAMEAYRSVISLYPSSDEAAQASSLLKVLYADRGQGDEYLAFMRSVDNAPAVDPVEAEKLSFDAAIADYKNNNSTAKLERFVKEYNSSSYIPRAQALLMEKAKADGNNDAADALADNILSTAPDSRAAEDALLHKAQTLYEAGQIPESLELWQQLETKASTPSMSTSARLGAMRAARDMGNFELAASRADAILNSSAAAGDLAEARYTKGLALDAEGKTAEAIELWQSQADDIADLYGAKSAFSAAEAMFESGQNSKALKAAQKFVQSGSPHRYWVARGFILVSDIYLAQGKKFEAREYLEALKDNYPGDESDIFMMIETRLDNEEE